VLKTMSDFPLRIAEETRQDRRRLLKLAGVAAVAACAGDWVARRVTASPDAPQAVHVPDVEAILPGTAQAVATADGRDVVVARLTDTTLVAYDRRCPHLGCPVVYAAARDRFECPCHHAAFDAKTGRVLFGPPRRGLTPVEVRA
jgi:Rieske Fe-S protein